MHNCPAFSDGNSESLFGDWLLAMRQEQSVSMFGAEEGEAAANAQGQVRGARCTI